MRIIIHKEIELIEGSIVEIETNTTRLFIDLGQNFPFSGYDNVNNQGYSSQLAKITSDADAIFYSHYHGDSLEPFVLTSPSIPQYIGVVGKELALLRAKQREGRANSLGESQLNQIKSLNTFQAKEPIVVGDITITPHLVSHSTYDAFLFLIEAEGKRLLYSGDFRDHGYLGGELKETLQGIVRGKKSVDLLITEGTMLSRLNEYVPSEQLLQQEFIEVINRYKYTFVACASTDMERFATLFEAVKQTSNEPIIVCDSQQAEVLALFTKHGQKKSNLFNFDSVHSLTLESKELKQRMVEEGFCMIVGMDLRFVEFWSSLELTLDKEEIILIYSMWKEFINPVGKYRESKSLDFLNRFPRVKLIHTSAHASPSCLEWVCELIDPKLGIIPIHSKYADNYGAMNISEELKKQIITTDCQLDKIEVVIKRE